MKTDLRSLVFLCALCALGGEPLRASPPVASYIFPAGGQRGTAVPVRVGGLYLHDRCRFDLSGPGVTSSPELKKTDRLWFEGPLLPLPDSQRAEDYPADMLGSVTVDAKAPLGAVGGRVSTSQGVASGLRFVVGDLPEVVEREIDGDPVPTAVALPVTANGRVFPREDVDLWAFPAKKGQSVSTLVTAGSLNSPLVARLEFLDPAGRVLAESGPRPTPGYDASVRFTAPADGEYQVRVSDVRSQGGPAYVYRLTVTTGPVVDHVYPLGGKRGTKLAVTLSGQGVPSEPVTIQLPADGATHTERISLGDSLSNPITFDIGDVPEILGPTAQPVTCPAMLNGRIERVGASNEWMVNLKKAEKYDFTLRARTLGSPLCGVLTLCDAAGKELARAEGADLAADPSLAFTAPADGVYTLSVTERFRSRGGPAFAYRLRCSAATAAKPDFRIKLAADVVNVPRGGSVKVKVSVERIGGFAEAIGLTAAGLPTGVAMDKATIDGKKKAAELTFTAAKDAKVSTGAVTLTAAAKGASRTCEPVHVAVAVPTPFKFDGRYTMNNSPRGQLYRRTYRLERNGFDGPITVWLADRQFRHLQGVTAPTLVVPPGRSEFEFACQLPAWIEVGRTCRVTIMAVGVVKDADGTEHTVSFTSGEQNHQMIVVPEPGRLAVDLDKPDAVIEPGTTLRVPFRLSRAPDLVGPAAVELVVPRHWSGITSKPVTVSTDYDKGELAIELQAGAKPLLNMPATIRAVIRTDRGPVLAETKLHLLPRE